LSKLKIVNQDELKDWAKEIFKKDRAIKSYCRACKRKSSKKKRIIKMQES